MNQKHYKNHNKKANRLLELLMKQEKLEKIKPRIKKISYLKRFFNWIYKNLKRCYYE